MYGNNSTVASRRLRKHLKYRSSRKNGCKDIWIGVNLLMIYMDMITPLHLALARVIDVVSRISARLVRVHLRHRYSRKYMYKVIQTGVNSSM